MDEIFRSSRLLHVAASLVVVAAFQDGRSVPAGEARRAVAVLKIQDKYQSEKYNITVSKSN